MSQPPIAARRPHRSTYHGITLEDPYHWLRDPSYPEVNDADILAHLKAENDYFATQMEAHQPLIDTLYKELVDRQQPDDASVSGGGVFATAPAFTARPGNGSHGHG